MNLRNIIRVYSEMSYSGREEYKYREYFRIKAYRQ